MEILPVLEIEAPRDCRKVSDVRKMRPAAAFRGGEMSLMVRTPVPCWPQGKRFCRAVPPRTVFVHFQRAFRACAATDILVAGAGFPVPARVRICCIAFPSQKGMTACSALVRGHGAPPDSSAVPDRTSHFQSWEIVPMGMRSIDSFYFSAAYMLSSTGSSHSLRVSSPGTSTAIWENQLSAFAPCQCLTPAGIGMTVPGSRLTGALPSS